MQIVSLPHFNCDESLSEEDSPQKPITPPTTSNYDFTTPSSNVSSTLKLYDNSPFKQRNKTPQTDICIDRSRHPSQDQSNLLPPPTDITTKLSIISDINQKQNINTLHHLQHLKNNHSLSWLSEN